MPRTRSTELPRYRRHKKTGQAVVTLTDPTGRRRDYYLGNHESDASKQKYNGVIAAWIGAEKALPPTTAETPSRRPRIRDIAEAFKEHARTYYRRADKTSTAEYPLIKRACDLLVEKHGDDYPETFGPLRLYALRDDLVELRDEDGERRLARTYINKLIARVKRCFRWAAKMELATETVYLRLSTVEQLKVGRSEAREPKRRAAVSEADLRLVLPHLTSPVTGLVRFMWQTGARVGEAVQLRGKDVDMTGDVWMFEPGQHKLLHRDMSRIIAIGPACQRELTPFVKLDPMAFWFSPRDALKEKAREKRAKRKSKVWDSHKRRYAREKARRPRRKVGDRYSPAAVRHAIARACAAAGIEPWTPHALRHAALSRIRKERGIEAAAAIAGHSAIGMTEHYSRDAAKVLAMRIAGEVG